MLPSILIIATSMVLFVYWFRSSCRAALRCKLEGGRFHAPDAIHIDDLQRRIGTENQLDLLHRSLDRHYEILTYLRRNASGFDLSRFEDRLLVWYYRAMYWRYRLTKTAAPQQARRALHERAAVLAALFGRAGRRAVLQTQA